MSMCDMVENKQGSGPFVEIVVSKAKSELSSSTFQLTWMESLKSNVKFIDLCSSMTTEQVPSAVEDCFVSCHLQMSKMHCPEATLLKIFSKEIVTIKTVENMFCGLSRLMGTLE